MPNETKDDFAAVQYADELVTRSFVVIDLEELLLCKCKKGRVMRCVWDIQMLLFDPSKDLDLLLEHFVALSIVSRN